jgi:NAD+ synthase
MMKNSDKRPFSKDILFINDINSECDKMVSALRENVLHRLHRIGAVIGISGGIDSAVCMVLVAKALGAENVLSIMLPEQDSSNDSALFAQRLADKFGVKAITENITGALQGFGCYQRRDEAVKRVLPEYDPINYKMKIGIRSSGLYTNLPPLFSVTIVDKDGNEQSKRLPPAELMQIEAALLSC